jgi:hypothetical protein
MRGRPIRSETRATLVASIARGRHWLDELLSSSRLNLDFYLRERTTTLLGATQVQSKLSAKAQAKCHDVCTTWGQLLAQRIGDRLMSQFWEMLKNYSGPILLGFGTLGLLLAIGYAFLTLVKLVTSTPAGGIGPLPLLAIGGVIVLILMLTVVAMVFSVLGLTNKAQAMGLPEGSIRAVIALSLIVLFAILSVFLYRAFRPTGRSTPFRTSRIRSGPSSSATTPTREMSRLWPFPSRTRTGSHCGIRTERQDISTTSATAARMQRATISRSNS